MRHKLMRNEKTIKDYEEKMKFYKNFGEERMKLLSKIEELNVQIEEDVEKIDSLDKQNDYYKQKIISLDNDNIFLKRQIDTMKINDNPDSFRSTNIENTPSLCDIEVADNTERGSLLELEENTYYQKTIIELEAKVSIYSLILLFFS